jgi:hypothetical protein
MDLTTKKFTITLPMLLGILSAISTIIAGYWYFKNTIESTKSSIISANENYKELKTDIQILREQVYEMAIAYNNNIHIENEIHRNDRKSTLSLERYSSNNERIFPYKSLRVKNQRDTINTSRIKSKPDLSLKPIIRNFEK